MQSIRDFVQVKEKRSFKGCIFGAPRLRSTTSEKEGEYVKPGFPAFTAADAFNDSAAYVTPSCTCRVPKKSWVGFEVLVACALFIFKPAHETLKRMDADNLL